MNIHAPESINTARPAGAWEYITPRHAILPLPPWTVAEATSRSIAAYLLLLAPGHAAEAGRAYLFIYLHICHAH